MLKIELRNQRMSDANNFYKILNNPNFKFFKICPKSIEAEREILHQNNDRRKRNYAYNYSILCDGKLVGGCGIKIDQHRKFTGEIGYFIDESYWGKGIATKAVKLLEKIGFNKLGLSRIEIIMDIKHGGSEKVAINCGYKKEGLMKTAISNNNQLKDAYLYAKVLK